MTGPHSWREMMYRSARIQTNHQGIDAQMLLMPETDCAKNSRAGNGRGRACAKGRGQSLGRPLKLTAHQKHEAIKRRNEGGETLAEIARSYTVSQRRFRG